MSGLFRAWQVFLACVSSLVSRRSCCCVVLALVAAAVIHGAVLESYQIPTGSMAPTLRGHHRVCTCPQCGQEVAVGRALGDAEGSGHPRYYRKAFCPNCGLYPLPIDTTAETPGHRVLVNKSAFLCRAPRRWEIVVFRLLGSFYIKRLLGLPGEEVVIHDGDLYVNGALVRKTLEEARALRVLVFDQEHVPPPHEGKSRWEISPPDAPSCADTPAAPAHLMRLDGRSTPRLLTYRHYSLGSAPSEPLCDEHAYNSGMHPDREPVHDFLVEMEVEIAAGQGSLALRLCDGQDQVEVILPVGEARRAEAFCWPTHAAGAMRKLGEMDQMQSLQPGRRHAITCAFVDRRLTLEVDGCHWLGADLPMARGRQGVTAPLQIQADGLHALVHRLRLYRDVHYGQQGWQGVKGKSVRLGVDQYFVLGDNSPNSQDSRFWPDQGRIPAQALIGPAWLVYGSSPLRRLP